MGPCISRASVVEEDLAVGLLHLLERVGGVEGCDGHVAAIQDCEAAGVGVDVEASVVAAAGFLAGGRSADATGTEACARAVGGGGVIREAEDGDVEGSVVGRGEAPLPGEVGESDGLGEGKVFVEVFDGVGVVGSDVDISLERMCARGEGEEECEG